MGSPLSGRDFALSSLRRARGPVIDSRLKKLHSLDLGGRVGSGNWTGHGIVLILPSAFFSRSSACDPSALNRIKPRLRNADQFHPVADIILDAVEQNLLDVE